MVPGGWCARALVAGRLAGLQAPLADVAACLCAVGEARKSSLLSSSAWVAANRVFNLAALRRARAALPARRPRCRACARMRLPPSCSSPLPRSALRRAAPPPPQSSPAAARCARQTLLKGHVCFDCFVVSDVRIVSDVHAELLTLSMHCIVYKRVAHRPCACLLCRHGCCMPMPPASRAPRRRRRPPPRWCRRARMSPPRPRARSRRLRCWARPRAPCRPPPGDPWRRRASRAPATWRCAAARARGMGHVSLRLPAVKRPTACLRACFQPGAGSAGAALLAMRRDAMNVMPW